MFKKKKKDGNDVVDGGEARGTATAAFQASVVDPSFHVFCQAGSHSVYKTSILQFPLVYSWPSR